MMSDYMSNILKNGVVRQREKQLLIQKFEAQIVGETDTGAELRCYGNKTIFI
jgi:hypothetical protein